MGMHDEPQTMREAGSSKRSAEREPMKDEWCKRKDRGPFLTEQVNGPRSLTSYEDAASG